MDSIGDMLTRIRNASMVKKERALVPNSKINRDILAVLLGLGYIGGFSKRIIRKHQYIEIELKYDGGNSTFKRIKRISKPSRRVYIGAGDIRPRAIGRATWILSTPKGVLPHTEAKKNNVGGELMFSIS